MVKDAGFEHWFELFRAKNNNNRWYLVPGRPTLEPWVATTSPSAAQFVMERNPYYYKVDPEGNQLPYIDKIVFNLTENKEVINLKAMTGEIDFQFRHIQASNYTVLKENEDKENYRILEYLRDLESDCIITLNISHKDPAVRQVIGDKRFRIALSYAINREEINELAYGGLAGEPRQASPFPESPYFLPEFAYAYIEYDPDQANALLDEMGLTERDGDGFRLRPDGETMTLTIEYAPVFGPWNDVAELTKEYWENIGIKTAMKPIERSLWQERYEANELEVSMWSGTAGMMPLTWPRYYVPTGGQVLWGRAFQLCGMRLEGKVARSRRNILNGLSTSLRRLR